MSTLAEIEAATDTLPIYEKEELMKYIASQLDVADCDPASETEKSIAMPPGNPRVVMNARTGLPLIVCTPGNIINPTKEELGDV